MNAHRVLNADLENGGSKYVVVRSNGGYKRIKTSFSEAQLDAPVLPDVDADDNGKILGVSSGEWSVMNPPSGLPSVTGSDNGKFLGVSSGEWAVLSVPTELPAVTASDEGKVLMVNSSGNWVAGATVTQNAQTGDLTFE